MSFLPVILRTGEFCDKQALTSISSFHLSKNSQAHGIDIQKRKQAQRGYGFSHDAPQLVVGGEGI